MNDNEKLTVLKFFEGLVTDLRLIDLVDSLISSRAITTEDYQQVDHKPTDKAKMRELLVLLLDKRHPNDIDIFQCLLRSMRKSRADLAEGMETEYRMLVEQAGENYKSYDDQHMISYVEDEHPELASHDADISDSPFHCRLAPSFEESSFWLMDERLKLAMAQTTRLVNELGDYSWENLLYCMLKNSFIEPIEGSRLKKSDKFRKSKVNQFKFDGSAKKDGIDEINSWIEKLIMDKDIATEIIKNKDTVDLVSMAAETGALVDSVGTFFHKKVRDTKDADDTCVLRYPESKCPYLKVYTVCLKAVRICSRTLYKQDDLSEIDGEIHTIQFKLRNYISKPPSSS